MQGAVDQHRRQAMYGSFQGSTSELSCFGIRIFGFKDCDCPVHGFGVAGSSVGISVYMCGLMKLYRYANQPVGLRDLEVLGSTTSSPQKQPLPNAPYPHTLTMIQCGLKLAKNAPPTEGGREGGREEGRGGEGRGGEGGREGGREGVQGRKVERAGEDLVTQSA